MYKLSKKSFVFLLFFLIFLFAARHIYVSLFVRVKTEYAKFDVYSEYIDACALFIRDEILVKDDSEFVRVIIDDKRRIAKNQVIYLTYDSEEDLDNDYQNSISGDEIVKSNNVDYLNYHINDLIRKSIREKKYYPQIENLIINKENLMKKGVKKTSRNRSEMKSNKVRSKESGIFSYFADGFEDQLSTKINFDNLNFKDYKKDNPLDENVIGKIVTGSKCVIVCDRKVDRPGSYEIKLEMSSDEIKCHLSKSYDNISVFEAEVNDSSINSRLENVKIKTSCVEGIKIRKEAVHDVNGQKGVFVLDRKVVKFKEINIKYESDYVVCEYDRSNLSSLQENDAVIVSGNNLYDGRILMY